MVMATSEDFRNLEKDEVKSNWISQLTTGKYIVTFKKKNGEMREMRCTLEPDVVPEVKGTGRNDNNEVIAVWDLDKKDWRSFRIDSVTKVEHIYE